MKLLTALTEKLVYDYVDYFSERKWISLPLFFLFSLFIIFLHDTFVQVSIYFTQKLSVSIYNIVVLTLASTIGTFFFFIFKHQLSKQHDFYGFKYFYTFFTFVILVTHTFTMLEMYIELIHAVLYAALALIAFPLFQNYGKTIFFCLPVMFLDEWFQYRIMYPEFVKYFEINDILLDTIGVGICIVFLMLFNAPIQVVKGGFWNQNTIRITTFVILLLGVGFWKEWWVLYTPDATENTFFIFNQLENPFKFWQVHPFNNTTYHVLRPLQGLFSVLLLSLFYFQIDFYFRSKNYKP